MDSITKTKLSNDEIRNVTMSAFEQSTRFIEELKGGFFNAAYLITLENNDAKAVLKVAHSSDIKVLRTEKNIIKSEVQVLNHVRNNTNIPTPSVLHTNFNKDVIDHNYFFMNYIPGKPLDQQYGQLSKEEFYKISHQVGAYTKQFHKMKGKAFGYTFSGHKGYKKWSDAMISFIDDLILDAIDGAIKLPLSFEELRQVFLDKCFILDTVETPSFVHRDLWWGNIFIDPTTLQITGITDYERSLYGDPLLDFVFGFAEENEGFKNGYGRESSFSKREQCLLSLYQIYNLLLIIIEAHYRKYPNNEENEQKARIVLMEEIEKAKTWQL
ncbi:aminoglycoside phosphotransferase family protein [Bacillus sp. FJAT-49711]|uniref:phosphotransferase family protein n=1 Tax=Bacillus sp. FJAT-49711 TaxID=2833585 RepID=UPI001BCA6591|nr:aminoglycoside phosphotransferase family protein [Bacillus sp. FJAT-49711]MBS4219854.1 aminoglycoside phosphotransferase family protein [Bacillus sp. FJAT-49711]